MIIVILAKQNYKTPWGWCSYIETCRCTYIVWKTIDIYIYIYIYRLSQEEWVGLRESVPFVKVYRNYPKPLYPNLNFYGDNGRRFFKLWQLLHTYWLPNTYWNWQEYVVIHIYIYIYIYRWCQIVYTYFNDNWISTIFFDCPTCRIRTLAFID